MEAVVDETVVEGGCCGGGEDEEGEFKKAGSPTPSQGPKVFNVQSFLLCRSPPTDMYTK